MLKMNNMAKQVAWWEKELLALARFESVFQRRLASWNENDLTFFHTSIADMGERLREHEQALVTAVFESTKQLLNELVCQMRAYRSRLMNRLLVIRGCGEGRASRLLRASSSSWSRWRLEGQKKNILSHCVR